MSQELDIKLYPDPILRKVSAELSLDDIKSAPIQKLITDMDLTMRNKNGAGLAAPQVGESIRLILINHDEDIFCLINPVITKKSWARIIQDEGCLSVIDNEGEIVYEPVSRHKRINCVYLDKDGKKQHLRAEGDLARAIQHEVDHLEGILFIDYLKNPPANID